MISRIMLILAFCCTAALADPPPPPRAPNPLPPPPPVFSNKPSILNSPRSALDRYPPNTSSNWQRLQDSIDRSTGRIVDDQLYETQRLERLRDERLQQLAPQREFDRLQQERERRLRIEQRARQEQFDQQDVNHELDRREYELFLNAGASPVASQAWADEQALRAAQAQRDTAILKLNDERNQQLKQNPANAPQINAQFQKEAQQARDQYEKERKRILGFPPTTAPSTQPAGPTE
ncbi:MAG TPA: hypothetical protein VHM90_21960 [Phycisphaerae bacterium]|nr:hypothetical protein [Phycisphaerae bacterium]